MPRVSIPARRIVFFSRWPKVSSPTLARNAVFFPYALSAARKLPGAPRGIAVFILGAFCKIDKQLAQRDHIIHRSVLLCFLLFYHESSLDSTAAGEKMRGAFRLYICVRMW